MQLAGVIHTGSPNRELRTITNYPRKFVSHFQDICLRAAINRASDSDDRDCDLAGFIPVSLAKKLSESDATKFSHARNNATVCRSYRMCRRSACDEQTKVRRCRPRPIKEIGMRRNLLELLRNPVNTGVAIGLLIGLAYLEFSASTQAPETRDASERPTRCHDQFVIGHVRI